MRWWLRIIVTLVLAPLLWWLGLTAAMVVLLPGRGEHPGADPQRRRDGGSIL